MDVADSLGAFLDVVVHARGSFGLELLEHGQLLGGVVQSSQAAVDSAVARVTVNGTPLALLLDDLGGFGTGGNSADVEGVVPLEGLVVLKLAAEVDLEEEVAPQEDHEGNAERDTDDGADGERGQAETGGALEDDVEDVDGDGDGEVEGNGSQAAMKRVLVLQDQPAGEDKDESSDETGNNGGDEPAEDDHAHTGPLDSVETKAGDTSTSDGTDNGVGCGDGQTAGRGEEDPGGGTNQGADHGKHEELGLVTEQADVDQTALDGVGGLGAHEEGAQELADRGDENGLLEVQGSGTDSSTETVGDIVGADTV